MDSDPGCVFCSIVAGEAPASRIPTRDGVTAFMDIRPVTQGHLLVIPDRHAELLGDLDPSQRHAMFEAGNELAGALRKSGLPCDGVNLYVADGEAAGQEVFHVHLHVIPRTVGDGFRVDADAWRRPPPERAELDDQAARIARGRRGHGA